MKHILITRPQASAVPLAEKINAQTKGIIPIIFPAIEIKSISENPFASLSWHKIDSIIFISPAAVESAARFIGPLPASIKLFVPGQDTANKIQALGLGKALYPQHQFNSEALLNLEELQWIKNHTILICKGKGGNPLLLETLSARGANIIEIICYERRLPAPMTLPDLNKIDLILCTSIESLKNLLLLLGSSLKEKTLLVSSEKIKAFALTLGFKHPPLLAENAGDEALINAMIKV